MNTDASVIVREIDARFVSGNSVPVERASIRKHEWDAMKRLMAAAPAQAAPEGDARQADLLLESMLGEMLRHDADETHPNIRALQFAIARLSSDGGLTAAEREALARFDRDLRHVNFVGATHGTQDIITLCRALRRLSGAVSVDGAMASAVLTEYVRICVNEHPDHADKSARVEAMRRALVHGLQAKAP